MRDALLGGVPQQVGRDPCKLAGILASRPGSLLVDRDPCDLAGILTSWPDPCKSAGILASWLGSVQVGWDRHGNVPGGRIHSTEQSDEPSIFSRKVVSVSAAETESTLRENRFALSLSRGMDPGSPES